MTALRPLFKEYATLAKKLHYRQTLLCVPHFIHENTTCSFLTLHCIRTKKKKGRTRFLFGTTNIAKKKYGFSQFISV